MSDEAQSKIVDLEIRITHQEAAIEELTSSFLSLEKQMRTLEKEFVQIKSLLKEIAPSLVAPQSEEKPPPHY